MKVFLRRDRPTYISLAMLPGIVSGEEGPWVVMLHWLGGGARSWMEVSENLTLAGMRCTAVDLPGFGDACAYEQFSIEAMAEEVMVTIAGVRGDDRQSPWLLVGHSMGGKLAAVVARAAAQGRDGLAGLVGLVLISPSPPGPEPMQERKREQLLKTIGQSTGNPSEDREYAEKFVDDNTGKFPLADRVRERAVEDGLRTNRAALRAWLTEGSREDWSAHVATLTLPVCVLAGTEEADLGPEAQQVHTLPHFAHARLFALQGCGHLAPLERPAEVSERICMFVEALNISWKRSFGADSRGSSLGRWWSELIASDFTSPQTREVLQSRLQDGQQPAMEAEQSMPFEERLTLRALSDRVVPGCSFDLARRICFWLTQSQHDGWRDDKLPGDREAWSKGLRSLDLAAIRESGVSFIALDAAHQDALLRQAHEGRLGRGLLGTFHLGDGKECFDGEQMQAWFEDVRGEMARLYVADPRTMERIGFTGFADEHGFTQIRLNEREVFEP